MKPNFSNQLQKALSLNGMTQKQLAEKAGITEAAVCHYLKGDRTPRAVVLQKIAEVLNCSVEYLLGTCMDNITHFDELYDVVARNLTQLSAEQKSKLAALLLKEYLIGGMDAP